MDFRFHKWIFVIVKSKLYHIGAAIIIALWIVCSYVIARGRGAVIGYWDIIITLGFGSIFWLGVYAIRPIAKRWSEKELRLDILQAIQNQKGRATLDMIAIELKGDPVFLKGLLHAMLEKNVLKVQKVGNQNYYVIS